MECTKINLSSSNSALTNCLKPKLPFSPPPKFTTTNSSFRPKKPAPPVLVVSARAGSSQCEPSSGFSGLNNPLEPTSASGKFLSGVLQNQRPLFHIAVAEELKLLADDRCAAVTRMFLSSSSDEALLHRRIAELKERESQAAIKDIIYVLILYKFSESRVPLVPKLSRCIYNGRLEIWPSKDWELESIHDFEALELIKEHISTITGLHVNASVADNWATTEIQKLQLGRIYAASILYGYFLNSASLRHYLECCLLAKHENLRSYVAGFDSETLQRCAKLKSREAVNLIEKHTCALFGDLKTGLLENDDVILTSFSSMKRLVLEAVAFGSFLWDTEEYVDSIFKLQEN